MSNFLKSTSKSVYLLYIHTYRHTYKYRIQNKKRVWKKEKQRGILLIFVLVGKKKKKKKKTTIKN